MFGESTIYSVQKVNIPSISVAHVQNSSGAGSFFLPGNIIEFEHLQLNLLVDENLEVWVSLYDYLSNYHKISTSDSFCTQNEISWVEIYDNRNNYLFKIEFNNCFLQSIGSLEYSHDEDDKYFSLPITIVYDYFNIIK